MRGLYTIACLVKLVEIPMLGSNGSLQATSSKMLQRFTEVVDKVKGE
jgi:hypothetical protein